MRKQMARVLATVLASSLLFGCGGQGSQANQGGQGADGSEEGVSQAESQQAASQQGAEDVVDVGDYVAEAKDGKVVLPGFTFTLPDDIAQGGHNVAGWTRIDFDGAWGRIWIYDPDEDLVSQTAKPGFFEIEGVPAGTTMRDALDRLEESGQEVPEGAEDCYIDLGENGTFHYYALDVKKLGELVGVGDEDLSRYGIDQARIDQAKELEGRIDEYVGCFEPTDLALPTLQRAQDVDASTLANITLDDLNGDRVRLGDVFAENKLTMIDIWRTSCDPCIKSMPDLDELHQSMRDKGFGVLGVNCDVLDEDDRPDESLLADALAIVDSTGTTFPTVLADSEFLDLVDVYATPTAIFVDGEGNVVDGPSLGAHPKDLLATIIEDDLDKVS